MTRRWVVNASPVIVLSKIGRIDLLSLLCQELVIPESTAKEIQEGASSDPSVHWIRGEGKNLIAKDAPLSPEVSAWDLGAGETAVLSWALQNSQYEAVVDDRAARNCASVLQIPVRGTLGVILLAKKSGIIELVAPILHDVLDAGLRVHPELQRDILRLAGEAT